jgi:hypothetical protein
MDGKRIYCAQHFEIKMQEFMIDWLIAQAIRCRLLAVEPRVQSRVTSYEIHGERSGSGAGYRRISFVSAANHNFIVASCSSLTASWDMEHLRPHFQFLSLQVWGFVLIRHSAGFRVRMLQWGRDLMIPVPASV